MRIPQAQSGNLYLTQCSVRDLLLRAETPHAPKNFARTSPCKFVPKSTCRAYHSPSTKALRLNIAGR